MVCYISLPSNLSKQKVVPGIGTQATLHFAFECQKVNSTKGACNTNNKPSACAVHFTFLPGHFLCRECRPSQADHQAASCISAPIPVLIKSPHAFLNIHNLIVGLLLTAVQELQCHHSTSTFSSSDLPQLALACKLDAASCAQVLQTQHQLQVLMDAFRCP